MNDQTNFSHLIYRHLQRILQLINLETSGKVALPNIIEYCGRKNNRDKKSLEAVKCEFTESYARNEPRIGLIKKSLERIMLHADFLHDNTKLDINSFRLYNLKNWANYGPIGIQQNVGEISSYCNCNCEFCYERGARSASLPWRRTMLSVREAKTRIKYYSKEKLRGIVAATNYTLEPFTNPRCMDIIELIREADPKSWITLFTNGALLDEKTVSRLAKAQPLLIVLSLNASTPEVWLRTMRGGSEKAAKAAFHAMELLRDYEVPTIGSYVPWPSKPLSDLVNAVHFMDSMDLIRARICLPTFTRFHVGDPPFNHETYWAEILETAKSLRPEVRIPVGLMPALYEIKTILPIIHGVIKNSPAESAGFRFGDRVIAIDGQEVFTIPGVRSILGQRAMMQDTIKSTTFTIQRDGQLIDINVKHPEDLAKTEFPYRAFARWGSTRYSNSLGIHFTDGFHITYIAELAEICEEYKGKVVLLFTTELMEPHFAEALSMAQSMLDSLESVELYVGKPKPTFFGGSVVIGDLWVIPDLISYTKDWIKQTGIHPDVVIVPSSFLSVGKRDLLGHTCIEFERELDIELKLIECLPIAD